jgi:hypothetical protein
MESPETPANKNKTLSERDILWNSAGMHRPIASFWYNYIFILIAAIPGILIIGWLIPSVLMPDPTALGMATVVTTYFQLLFVMFDLGTGLAIERFIAEHAVKNPKRAIQYLQFFSWFQLFTGLVQTTIVAIYVLNQVRQSTNAFLAWPFLIFSLTQWPGMLGVYKHALASFQQHDKQIIVELFQNVLFQSINQIGFILLGRWWGASNPIIGEVMGAALGFIFGSYINDFTGMILATWFFSKVIKPLGYKMRSTFIPDFDISLVKEVLIYGLKVVPAYAIEAGVKFLVLLMTMNWLPNYTTIIALFTLASGVASVTSVAFTITPAISESYNNGYYNLTQYYIKQQWKHWAHIASFLFVMIYMIIPPVFRYLSGEYALAAEIMPILLVTRLLIFPINFGSSVAQGINKPEYQTFALFIEQTVRALSFFFFLNPWGSLLTILGPNYALALYITADVPAFCSKLVFQWLFVKRTIKFSIAPNFYQTFVAPVLTAIPLFLITSIPVALFNRVVQTSDNMILAIGILAATLLIALFTFPMLIVYPFSALVGGWDDDGLEAFRLAAQICGPSSFLVKPMVKLTIWAHNLSPMKNKFPIDFSKAKPEAEELSKKRIEIYLQGKNPDA